MTIESHDVTIESHKETYKSHKETYKSHEVTNVSHDVTEVTAENQMLPILFYDGDCALCNRFVRFITDNIGSSYVRFASLQGDTAKRIRSELSTFPQESDSIVFLVGDHPFVRSKAIFRVLAHLNYPWKALSWFRLFPTSLADIVYRMLARNRYGLFGRADSCTLSHRKQTDQFLP